ncbi:MAG: hypothetical protein EBR30_14540 [Cytophagia bacterium]|nr:hypothetical protein [Cytophagia bacterium]
MREVIIIILTLFTINSFGCTCSENIKEKDLIRNADYAFEAEVISNIYQYTAAGAVMSQMDIRTDAKVRITRKIKGLITKDEVIIISSESSSCAINLIPGKRYLITGGTTRQQRPLDKISFDLPPINLDSLINQDSVNIIHTEFRTKKQWIEELSKDHLIIFTSVCESRYRK